MSITHHVDDRIILRSMLLVRRLNTVFAVGGGLRFSLQLWPRRGNRHGNRRPGPARALWARRLASSVLKAPFTATLAYPGAC